MNAKVAIFELLRPFFRLTFPLGRNYILAFIGAGPQSDSAWLDAQPRHRVFFDRDLGAYVWVDLIDWGGRSHYYYSNYYDRTNQALIRRCLKLGDTYIDIGANYGIHSLFASKVVGPQGKVYSFEPNPRTFDVIKLHMAINRIENSELFNMGLSDQAGEFQLSGGNHAGTFTLREVKGTEKSISVPIGVGDQVLQGKPMPGKILVKLDVEGFEHNVLKGLRELRKLPNIAFTVEITDDWLKQTGSSAAALISDMVADGFKMFRTRFKWKLLKRGLTIDPVESGCNLYQYDLLFAKPGFFDATR